MQLEKKYKTYVMHDWSAEDFFSWSNGITSVKTNISASKLSGLGAWSSRVWVQIPYHHLISFQPFLSLSLCYGLGKRTSRSVAWKRTALPSCYKQPRKRGCTSSIAIPWDQNFLKESLFRFFILKTSSVLSLHSETSLIQHCTADWTIRMQRI